MTYLTMQEASEQLPGNPTPETVRNRCIRGDLRGIFDGDRWFTTPEYIQEFLQRMTDARTKVHQPIYPAVHSTIEGVIAKYARSPNDRRKKTKCRS
jgi:hypothetical protein